MGLDPHKNFITILGRLGLMSSIQARSITDALNDF